MSRYAQKEKDRPNRRPSAKRIELSVTNHSHEARVQHSVAVERYAAMVGLQPVSGSVRHPTSWKCWLWLKMDVTAGSSADFDLHSSYDLVGFSLLRRSLAAESGADGDQPLHSKRGALASPYRRLTQGKSDPRPSQASTCRKVMSVSSSRCF